MLAKYRRYLYGLFTLFFVLVTPFLIIYSLGFEINLDKQKIANTLSINIETLPRGATIKNKGFDIGKTPLEMKASDGEQVEIGVESYGYKTEDFVFWTEQNTNASARVTNLTLLPSNWDSIAVLGDAKPVGILSSSLLLFSEEGKYFVQGYNLGGLVGKKSDVIIKNDITITKTTWDQLSENVYWDRSDNLILAHVGSDWKFLDLSIFPLQAKNIVSTSDTQLLFLDYSARLWLLDLNLGEVSFLDSSIEGIYQTISPDNIWVWKQATIYRLNKGVIDSTTFTLEDNKIYSQNPAIEDLRAVDDTASLKDFYVSSVFQGLLFKIGKIVYYVPDFNKNIWQVTVADAQKVGVDNNTLFWLDSDSNLFGLNLLLKEEQAFGKVDLNGNPDNFRIFYYYTWRRVMVYSDKEVYSVWFDKDIINRNVVKYDPIKWIDLNCLPKVSDKFQFCQFDNKLVAYKNTAFF